MIPNQIIKSVLSDQGPHLSAVFLQLFAAISDKAGAQNKGDRRRLGQD